MRWEDERYVRLYTRDTLDWQALSFEAQGLLSLILRKVDRAGILRLGKHGKRGIAVAVGHGHRWDAIAPAVEELLADGCVAIRGADLVIPNFIAAQEAQASDRARQTAKRERDRDKAMATGDGHLSDSAKDELAEIQRRNDEIEDVAEVTLPVTPARHAGDVTQECHAGVSRRDGHAGDVTPSQPSLPNQPEEKPLRDAEKPAPAAAVGFRLEGQGPAPDPAPRQESEWEQLRDWMAEMRLFNGLVPPGGSVEGVADDQAFLPTAREANAELKKAVDWLADKYACDRPHARRLLLRATSIFVTDPGWPMAMTERPPWCLSVLLKRKHLGAFTDAAREFEWDAESRDNPGPIGRRKRGAA